MDETLLAAAERGDVVPAAASGLTPREDGIQKIRDLIEKFRDPNSAMFSDGPVGYIPASLLAPLVDKLAASAPPLSLTPPEGEQK